MLQKININYPSKNHLIPKAVLPKVETYMIYVVIEIAVHKNFNVYRGKILQGITNAEKQLLDIFTGP
jgi:hypothetical protein